MAARQDPFRTCSAAAVEPAEFHSKAALGIPVAKIGNFISLRFRYKLLCDGILHPSGQPSFPLISSYVNPPVSRRTGWRAHIWRFYDNKQDSTCAPHGGRSRICRTKYGYHLRNCAGTERFHAEMGFIRRVSVAASRSHCSCSVRRSEQPDTLWRSGHDRRIRCGFHLQFRSPLGR